MTLSQKSASEMYKDPAFWEGTWKQAQDESLFRQRNQTLQDTIDFWNRRARGFAENVMGDSGKGRINRVIQWLTEIQGVDLEDADVLDIGAGPGPFALAFAEKARSVVALEPAENMVAYLEEEMKKREKQNIEIICETWEDLDVESQGFQGKFELVFASMNPGIKDWETIHKALQCAKKYCYISHFAGNRQSSFMEELWKEVYEEELPGWPAHIMIIVNLLYTRGYELDFRVWEERRTVETTVEKAVSFFVDELKIFGKEEPFPEDRMKKALEKKAKNGHFTHDMVSKMGQVLVRL